MCNQGKNITAGDTVFVNLIQNCKGVFTFCSREFRSFTDLVKCVYGMARNCAGMAIMEVRNQSQGWSCRMPLMLVAHQEGNTGGLALVSYNNVSASHSRAAISKHPRQQELPFSWI